jgi:hypothetical protein
VQAAQFETGGLRRSVGAVAVAAEAVVQAHRGSVDAAEIVVEAERSTSYGRPAGVVARPQVVTT